MTPSDRESCYAAFKSKDVRFDGLFFVGVSSTGICCRPVCRAKLPKIENCMCFASAAEAEQAGFRPCLLCRPELAPGRSFDGVYSSAARRASRILEENCGAGLSLEMLAAECGCTSRHLRRVFVEEYSVTPVRYLQTCRLLLAKNLLADTNLSALDVAMASDFGSLRRMNELFRRQYGMPPSVLREKFATKSAAQCGDITVSLGYRPPYRWNEIVNFLAARVIQGIETVTDNSYQRAVRLKNADGKAFTGAVKVALAAKKHALSVALSDLLIPVLPQVLARVRRLFDLCCDPDLIYEKLRCMDDLRPGLCCVNGIRAAGCFDSFETAACAVLGQQITVKAAGTLAGRAAECFGVPVNTGVEGLNRVFPSADDIFALGDGVRKSFGTLGIISARSESIRSLASAIVHGKIDLEHPASPEEEIKKLMKIRGIGGWTAQYIAMRTMGWPDAFLETDAGIRRALPGTAPRDMLRLAERWRPWRSYAVFNLWNTL